MRQISAKLMGLSSNSRVTEKIEEQVNLACSAQIWQVKKEDPHSNPHHFFSFFSYTAALLCIPTIWLEALKTSRRGFLFISSCNYCAERLCCCCTLIQMQKKPSNKMEGTSILKLAMQWLKYCRSKVLQKIRHKICHKILHKIR